ncbi:MAG TPA: nuclear transport factor 2 family protein [Ktedonobacterales bacterium]|nr:nuclear transport factor 2 family protein [Ktedonobacterales bacterium]
MYPNPAYGEWPVFSLSPEARIERLHRLYAAINVGNLEEALAFVAPDFIEHAGGREAVGHAPLIQAWQYTWSRLMKMEMVLCSAQAIGPDLLLVSTEIRATTREGQPYRKQAAHVVQFNAQGLMSEHWVYPIQQIGPVAWAKGGRYDPQTAA